MNGTIKMLLLIFKTFSIAHAAAQTNADVERTIRQQDSLFWVSYNSCDTTANKKFFTDDVEFYHDKGGITTGAQSLAASVKNNLCSNPGFRLRRQAVAGTVQVFPMRNGQTLYGAVISGQHLFYVIEHGTERLDGLARFTHLWVVKGGVWKMARILSYDHGPAPATGQ